MEIPKESQRKFLIKGIRSSAGLTQAQVAENLGLSPSTGQRTVSQIEQRTDWMLSSLVRYIIASGAEAAMTVTFGDGRQVALPLTDWYLGSDTKAAWIDD